MAPPSNYLLEQDQIACGAALDTQRQAALSEWFCWIYVPDNITDWLDLRRPPLAGCQTVLIGSLSQSCAFRMNSGAAPVTERVGQRGAAFLRLTHDSPASKRPALSTS